MDVSLSGLPSFWCLRICGTGPDRGLSQFAAARRCRSIPPAHSAFVLDDLQPAAHLFPLDLVLRASGQDRSDYGVDMESLKLLDLRKIGAAFLGINVELAAFVVAAAKAAREGEEERNRVHWTDKNRWE